MDPCLLADPFVVSGWVKSELGAVESVRVTKSGLVIIVFLLVRGNSSLRVKRMGARNCFARSEKAAIERNDYWGSGKCES